MRIACRTHSSLMTGSMPGMAASTRETLALGSLPKAVEEPEKSFAFDVTCAWISMPMITSQSPVAPLMSFFGSRVRLSTMAFMAGSGRARDPGAALRQVPRSAFGSSEGRGQEDKPGRDFPVPAVAPRAPPFCVVRDGRWGGLLTMRTMVETRHSLS